MAGNEFFCTVKLDEDDWKAIKRAIMSIEKRLERIEAILDARGLDWDHPRVEEGPAKEPPKKWRILEPGEVVCSSDWICARSNLPSDPPHGLGWRPVDASVGTSVCKGDPCIFARPVADEPAKGPEPEHPAGPKPDPGEGYRLLSKDPPEDLQPWDEYFVSDPPEDLQPGDEYFVSWDGLWHESSDASKGIREQRERRWYRRKIEIAKEVEPAWEPKVGDWVKVTRPENWREWKDPLWREEMNIYDGRVFELVKWSTGRRASLQGIGWFFHRDWLSPAEPPASENPAEPEYREPVLPGDAGKECEFSDDGESWLSGWVYAWVPGRNWVTLNNNSWKHARIKKDA